MQSLFHTSACRGLTLIALLSVSGLAFSEPAELDVTITLMQPGETPEGFVNRIELPPADAMGESAIRVEQEGVLDITTTDIDDLTTEVQQTINTAVTDAISVGDATQLPASVLEVLADDVVIEVPDEVIDELVDDLVDELDDVDTAIDDVIDLTPVNHELNAESEFIDSAILEQSFNDDMEPEVLEDLRQQMQPDELESFSDDLPLEAIDPLENDEIHLPDTDVINGL